MKIIYVLLMALSLQANVSKAECKKFNDKLIKYEELAANSWLTFYDLKVKDYKALIREHYNCKKVKR